MIDLPTGQDVLNYLGDPDADVHQADQHAAVAATLARSYTRSQGFDGTGLPMVEDDIGAVIVTAAARSLSNPEQAKRVEVGTYNSMPAAFNGWTLIELAVLHNYRRRAA